MYELADAGVVVGAHQEPQLVPDLSGSTDQRRDFFGVVSGFLGVGVLRSGHERQRGLENIERAAQVGGSIARIRQRFESGANAFSSVLPMRACQVGEELTRVVAQAFNPALDLGPVSADRRCRQPRAGARCPARAPRDGRC